MADNLQAHIKRSLILGLPIVASQVLQMLIGVTDSLMVAQLGELPLAQITLGTQFMFFAILTGIGLSMVATPIMSTAFAKGDDMMARRALRMSTWQAALLSAFFIVVAFWSRDILLLLGQDGSVIEGAGRYIDVALWALPFIFIGNAFRNYLLALERNNVLMLISVLGVLVNIIGNYALIFGHFGAPRLGLVGSAWATLFTNGAMSFATLLVVIREPLTKKIELFRNPLRADWGMFWRLIALGVPATFGLLSEVGMFQAATLMMGWIGVSELAAFGLVLQIASLTFMIPLGFSIVASVRAGQSVGHHDRGELLMVAKSTVIIITAVMCFTASLFLLVPRQLIGLLIDAQNPENSALVALSVGYLVYAAAFQIFDGAQVAAISLLRGMQDMLIPAILAFIAYWCIGMPIGYYLAFYTPMGGSGVWVGLVLGLFAASIFLWMRFYQLTREDRLEKRFLNA